MTATTANARLTATVARRRPPRLVAAIALVALAVNSVLIQTVAADNEALKQGVRGAVLMVVLVALLARNVYVPQWLTGLLLASMSLLVLRQNPDQLSIVFALILALLLCLLPERTVLKYAAVAAVAALGLIFLLLWTGATVNQEIVLEKAGRIIRERQAYGTKGVPFFFNIVAGACMLSLLYAYRYWSRQRFALTLGAVLALSYQLFRTTDARGGFLTVLLFAGLLVIVPRVRIPIVYASVPVVLVGATPILAYLTGYEVNRVLSNRPVFYRMFLEDREWFDFVLSTPVKATAYPVDNSYIHLAVGGGLVMLAVFLALFWRAIYRLMERRLYGEVAFLIAAATYCASESLIVRIELVWIVYVWYLLLRHGTAIGRPSFEVGSPVQRARGRRADATATDMWL
ncbi:hypothetical protein AB0N29_11770 [Nocardioides sp. NPDC092400]|uniref:hypothetical protein n=1 Tax=Nocardioides sp. NPDC092400 TaxID=3155196 RepID=UPI003417A99F